MIISPSALTSTAGASLSPLDSSASTLSAIASAVTSTTVLYVSGKADGSASITAGVSA